MHSFEKIDAHLQDVTIPDYNVLEKLQYPNITIPNRTLAWSLHSKGEGSGEVSEIKKSIREYNEYVEELSSLENFKEEFSSRHYSLRKEEAASLWGTEAAEKFFGLRRYPFETPLRVNGDWLFAPDVIPTYEVSTGAQKILFKVEATDNGYPSESKDGTKRLIWNWTDDYRDFCFYLWELFDQQGWLPDEDGDDDPVKSYRGFECYDQHRDCMDGPDVNLWRCAQILMDTNYLKVYELHPEQENPWWNLRGTADGTITLGVLDKAFLKNKVQKDKLRLVLQSSEEVVKSHKYILLDSNKHPYFSDNGAQYGGHYKLKIYGRLDCPSAKQFLAKGQYAQHRVFFKDEQTATATGFRPCAICMPEAYARWSASQKTKRQ